MPSTHIMPKCRHMAANLTTILLEKQLTSESRSELTIPTTAPDRGS